MTLDYQQLMEINLKGYKYAVGSMGMTMTSRHAYISTYYIVLEDDGENCLVAELEKRNRTNKLKKTIVARHLDNDPLRVWDKDKEAYVNAIEEL